MLSGSNPAASSNTRRAESLANLAAQSPTQANTNLSSTPNCGTQQQQPGLNKAIPPSTANSAPFSHTPDSTMPSTPMKKENGANNHTESLLTQLSPLNAPQAQQTKKEFVPTPTRSERKLNFGIDCCEMAHFTHWEPGGEHYKNLVVKNVAMKTQKIKYKLPKTKYFSVDFPETMTLSAGMSWTIPITFRPVAKECYYDVIEFATSFGKFNVPVMATLPEHVLEFPKTTDFDLCPIRETASKTFVLKNTGELSSHYLWDIPKPFSIYPKEGHLAPGASTHVTIEFKPDNASVYTATAVCTFGDSNNWDRSKGSQAMTVYGIGKYSYISVADNQRMFDFGDVYATKSGEKKLILRNDSAVHANFKIKTVAKDSDPYFVFSATSGTIAKGKQTELLIAFNPVAAGIKSTEYFDIVTVSGNTVRITCKGSGIGPKVALSTESVNFNDVPHGIIVMRALHIQNNSSSPAFFQFLTEPDSTFSIDKTSGTINPHSSVPLTIKFSPTEPINYHRRVYCLVEHQDAMYLDLIGTCYNDKRRPATFSPRHLEAYAARIRNGLVMYGPEQLEEMIKNGVIKCENGILSYVDPSRRIGRDKAIDSTYENSVVASEYFFENMGENVAVTLMDPFVDFGSCSRFRMIEPQTIRIYNRTKGKMSCVWVVPGEKEGETEPCFTIHPNTGDILPKSFTEFRVHFHPKSDNAFYGKQLECFVYFKSMRSFRLVTEDTFTPPWCLTPVALGNTFPPGEDSLIPKINVGAERLDFPSCYVDKSVYRSIRLTNTGDTAVMFNFIDDAVISSAANLLKTSQSNTSLNNGMLWKAFLPASAGGPSFSVKPRAGLLEKNESQLVVFRFSPGEARLYEQSLQILFNGSFSNSHHVQVRGFGSFPAVSFEDCHFIESGIGEISPYSKDAAPSNTICFKPTCIGAASKKLFIMRNTSKIAVNYEWAIPRQYSSFLFISPMKGTLAPNSTETLSCIFAPKIAKNWFIRIPCFFAHENEVSSEEAQRRTTFTIIGKGTYASIASDADGRLDFGPCLVNTVVEREMLIRNPCDCDVYFKVEVYSSGPDQVNTPDSSADKEDEVEKIVAKKDKIANAWGGIESPRKAAADELRENRVALVNSLKESEIEVIEVAGMLPARSQQAIHLRACLKEAVEKRFKIYYTLESPLSVGLDDVEFNNPARSMLLPKSSLEKTKELFYLCDVFATGVYRSIQVTDIRCEDVGFGKRRLWELFSLKRFNSITKSVAPDLQQNQIHDESSFPTESDTMESLQNKDIPTTADSMVDFDFGAAPVGTIPRTIHLCLKNTGVVPVEWAFNFPNDLEIEIEQWADPGDYTEEQLHYDMIIDNEIFVVSPKVGYLAPGESAHICLSYKHDLAGSHKLPVLFKLKSGGSGNLQTSRNEDAQAQVEVDRGTTASSGQTVLRDGGGGKEILINFIGYSAPSKKKYLHFHSSEHVFAGISIGSEQPPIQMYPLYNNGCVPLEYSIDVSPLINLKNENHGFPVLQCLKTRGTIQPGEVDCIEWIFNPLEEKQYEVDISIMINDGKTKIVTFKGQGLRENMLKTHPSNLPDDIPSVKVIKTERELACLSLERLVFGHVPIGATLRNVVVVQNTTNDARLSFDWIIPRMWKFTNLKIVPSRGELMPGESQVCKIIFKAENESRYYDFDAVCRIINESETAIYKEKKEAMEQVRRENRPLSGDSPTRERQKAALAAAAASTAEADAVQQRKQGGRNLYDIRGGKYKTLPPITPPPPRDSGDDGSVDALNESGEESSNPLKTSGDGRISSLSMTSSDQALNLLPPSPEPYDLHLGILAHSYTVNEFRKRFTGYESFFNGQAAQYDQVAFDNTFALPLCKEMIAGILTSALDEVMEDSDIHTLLEDIPKEPLVYFAQISTSESNNGIYLEDNSKKQSATSKKSSSSVSEKLIKSIEFKNLTESILENTLYNLMQEIDHGEFDFTKSSQMILK